MSYLVLARKWRPLNFDDVVGQDHITQTLCKAIEKDRVAHAYLFTGTRGVGKTTTARIFARALNCEKGPTPTPCGVCESCKGIINGSSFDVMEIDGASNNSVDDIRELRENIGYSSMNGKYRIYVIDEVHMLTKNAFNALLKTLEEPPPRVIFVFATTESNKIPATIHSRCQRYDFRRITAEQVGAQLEKICKAENVTYDMQALLLVARKADGSMRDALSLLDQVFSYGKDVVDEAHVRTVLGVVDIEAYRTIMDAVAAHDPKPVLDIVDSVLFHGYDLSDFIVGLEDFIRNLLFAKVPGLLTARSHEISADANAAFVKQSEKFSEATLLRMAEVVRRSETDLRWSSYPRFLIESMLLKLVHMDETISLEKLLTIVGTSSPVMPKIESAPTLFSAGSDEKKKSVEPGVTPGVSGVLPPWLPSASTGPEKPGPTVSASPEISPPAPVSLPSLDIDAVDLEGQQDSGDAEIDNSFTADATPSLPRDLHRDWALFLKQLVNDRPNIGSFLSQAHLASCSGSTIDLRYPANCKFQFVEVTKKAHRDLIVAKLSDFAKTPIDLHITIESPEQTNASVVDMRQGPGMNMRSIQDEIRNDPMIEKVLEFFDGEILN